MIKLMKIKPGLLNRLIKWVLSGNKIKINYQDLK